ncbi:MAG: AmmeMemoRadiSam system protein B [Clostridia bacterium]|nr:AmmeMemoRadiSam system protein B [Clostridia bacterium]
MRKILLIIITFIAFLSSCSHQTVQKTHNRELGYDENIKCRYYIEKSFKRSISLADKRKFEDFDIKGGIVPHHLLADDLIASFFKTVSRETPELLIILAPNHKNVGDYKVSTCYSSWETPYGLLTADITMAKSLVSEKGAGLNRKILEEEHSISSLIPYIKYYMPDCKVIPILLHGDYSLENSIELGGYISHLVTGKRYLILASVDFSHYLTGEAADKMDDISLEAIKKRDLKQIRQMNNDNMDSPPSIITLLSAMNTLNADRFSLLEHSNSDRISGTKAKETTSYFTMVFY